MSAETPGTLPVSQADLFASYTKLAGRVTNLRTIIQNAPLADCVTLEDAKAWAEDVRSVTQDFIFLTQSTLDLLRNSLPQESICKPLDHLSQK